MTENFPKNGRGIIKGFWKKEEYISDYYTLHLIYDDETVDDSISAYKSLDGYWWVEDKYHKVNTKIGKSRKEAFSYGENDIKKLYHILGFDYGNLPIIK